MKGLIIRDPWITMILDGEKTWEIRGSTTNIRGTIALIKSGTKHVYGTVELLDVIGPLTESAMIKNRNKHKSTSESLYNNNYAWVLENPKWLEKPTPYNHPHGAVIWVNLKGEKYETLSI